MSATVQPDRSRGFFHPDNFTFGQSLHLSEVYAAVERVPGVDSVEIVVFHRFGEIPLRANCRPAASMSTASR